MVEVLGIKAFHFRAFRVWSVLRLGFEDPSFGSFCVEAANTNPKTRTNLERSKKFEGLRRNHKA